MTRDEVLNMPAGREMDALVAEKAMGFLVAPRHVCGLSGFGAPGDICPGHEWEETHVANWKGERYSTDIAAAWEVVEKYRAINPVSAESTDTAWYAGFGIWSARADTAPLAICRAALLAVMEAI